MKTNCLTRKKFVFSFLLSLIFLSTHLPCLSQVNLTQGLIAYYPFNGNANDASSNGNNGSPQNGVQITSDRFGNANSAYQFDGINDYITIPGANSLNPTNAMSVALYFNASQNTIQTLIGKISYSQGIGTQFQVAILKSSIT